MIPAAAASILRRFLFPGKKGLVLPNLNPRDPQKKMISPSISASARSWSRPRSQLTSSSTAVKSAPSSLLQDHGLTSVLAREVRCFLRDRRDHPLILFRMAKRLSAKLFHQETRRKPNRLPPRPKLKQQDMKEKEKEEGKDGMIYQAGAAGPQDRCLHTGYLNIHGRKSSINNRHPSSSLRLIQSRRRRRRLLLLLLLLLLLQRVLQENGDSRIFYCSEAHPRDGQQIKIPSGSFQLSRGTKTRRIRVPAQPMAPVRVAEKDRFPLTSCIILRIKLLLRI